MTKYYYNGQLIRTSKTRDNYTHALIVEYYTNDGKIAYHCLGCSSKSANLVGQFNYYRGKFKNLRSNYNDEPVKIYVDAISKVSV